MKTMRNSLMSVGATFVLALSVVLAQDQAPQPPAPAPAEAPAPAPDALPAAPAAEAAQPAPAAPSGAVRPPPFASRRTLTPSATTVTRRASVPGVTLATPPAAGTSSATAASAGGEPRSKTTTPALKFDNSTSDFLLQAYAEETGKTLLIAPDVPKLSNINLRSQPGAILSRDEYLEAIEVTLSMGGVVLEPFGEKFLKVLARKTIRTEGIKILMEKPEGGHPEKSQVISQMIQLKAITISEAQKALEGFKKPEGLIQAFERTNSLLVTDTQENINRMLEIVRFIDQPLVATEEVNVRIIRFAKADDIKKRLEELVAESQKQAQAKEEVKANVSGAPGFTRTTPTTTLTRPLPPGLTRLGSAQPVAATPNESIETLVSDADRGMIRGKVQIISDERSNQLIIITRKENMNFFDKIITVLDIETAPDVKVEVQRMEYADAEEVSTMLNDLIGNATAKKEDKAPTTQTKSTPGEPNKSTTLAEALAARVSRPEAPAAGGGESGKSKLGALSKDNIKILADKRTNAIVMMGSAGDLAAIKEIIKNMDIKLSQVLIETVVLQVELGDDLKTGLDWVAGTEANGYTLKNGDKASGGGGSGVSMLGQLTGISTAEATSNTASVIASGVNYFIKSDKLNLAALITAAKSDNRTKVLSSPVLMTVDNKEASIEATSMRYLYKGVRTSGTSSYGYTEVPDYEQRDIGLTVKVTPRINPNGTVVMTIEETFETIGANQQVGDESYPTVNTRKLQADISVESMQTIVLGGLVQSEAKNEESGLPILKDIPVVGKYLFGSTSSSDTRSELLVFLTPYVMETGMEAEDEALRRKGTMSVDRPWEDGGWSKSRLADPVSEKRLLELEQKKWAGDDADYEARRTHDKALRARDEMLRKRAEKEAEESRKNGESVPRATSDEPVAGRMAVSEQVEVVRPAEAKKAEAEAAEPVPPEAEEPPKAWWRLW